MEFVKDWMLQNCRIVMAEDGSQRVLGDFTRFVQEKQKGEGCLHFRLTQLYRVIDFHIFLFVIFCVSGHI